MIEIRSLRDTDDRTKFRSGDPDLDRFFAKYAGQNQFRHHIGTTYVAMDGELLGYVTVAAGHIESERLPAPLRRALPDYPLPMLRIARLAVDATAQNRGVGSALLRHAFVLALTLSKGYGCVGVLVDAKPDAVPFYRRVGFSAVDISVGELEARPRSTPLFLPLSLVEAAVE